MKRIIITSMVSGFLVASSQAVTSTEVWNQYQTAPNTHANVPNNSYAGYRSGEAPVPNVPVVNSLSNFGGNGNGSTDNTQAFANAIADAAAKGGGAISIPAGTYVVNGMIRLNQSGVVLRGAGQSSTTIAFAKPLNQVVGPIVNASNQSKYSWSGGLIWIGPKDLFNNVGQLVTPTGGIVSGGTPSDEWEQWRSGNHLSGPRLANVSGTASKGAFAVTVDNASSLKPGMWTLMVWKVDLTNYSLHKHITGHPLMDSWSWSTSPGPKVNFRWPVQIQSISGNTVTLKQPLRLDVQSQWGVGFEPIGTYLQEAGVENLTLKMVGTVLRGHNQNDGYNGIQFNRTINCWAKNVTIDNAENGIFMSQCKNTTVTGLTVTGGIKMHHHTMNRFQSADNILQSFNHSADVTHGINAESWSSGNVWSKGTMTKGTFDSHRAMLFDNVRTEITVANTGAPGGANDAGPFNGKRVVHWNVNITGTTGLYIRQPDAHSRGALVGVRGASLDTTCAWAMNCGDKGNIVADDGLTPSVTNLHDSQLNLRKSNSAWVQLIYPYELATIAPNSNAILSAEGNPGSGRTISKMEFYSGSTLLGSDLSAPYSFTWNSVAGGVYKITARMTDNLSATATSLPATLVSGPVPLISINFQPSSAPIYPGYQVDSGAVFGNRGNGFSYGWTTSMSGAAFDRNSTASPDQRYDTGISMDGFTGTWDIALANGTYEVRLVSGDPSASTGITSVKVENQAFVGGTFTASTHWYEEKRWVTVSDGKLTLSRGNAQACPLAFITIGTIMVDGSNPNPVNAAPTVNLTSPATGTTYNAPASVSISATASDSDGTISKVEFLNGTTVLGTDTTSPYAMTWSNVGAGSYSISARATDNANATASSVPSTVTVSSGTASNPAPTVSITSPANGATFLAPASVAISASATDTSPGTVSNVQFLVGTTSIGTDTSSPYAVTWNSVSAGAYSLTARATDNGGASTTSAAVNITVNSSSSTSSGGLVNIKVNFQPASAPTVTGYLVDSGATYAARNGQTYGWTTDVSARALDRNSSLSADQRYDTLINLDGTTTSWEIALANGTYTVKLVSGDPLSTSTQSTNIALEGVTFLSGTFSSTTHWYEKTGTVTVSDGKLTLTRGGGADSPVCFIEITR